MEILLPKIQKLLTIPPKKVKLLSEEKSLTSRAIQIPKSNLLITKQNFKLSLGTVFLIMIRNSSNNSKTTIQLL